MARYCPPPLEDRCGSENANRAADRAIVCVHQFGNRRISDSPRTHSLCRMGGADLGFFIEPGRVATARKRRIHLRALSARATPDFSRSEGPLARSPL